MIYAQTTSVTVLSVVLLSHTFGPGHNNKLTLKNEHLQRLIDHVISVVSHLSLTLPFNYKE